MNISSITTDSAARYLLQPVKPKVPTDSTAKSAVDLADQPTDQAEQTAAVADKLPQPVANLRNAVTTGVVTHVVVSYDKQGKVLTKFVDSRNNVVYQTPSELAAKLEEQISASSTSTNIKE